MSAAGEGNPYAPSGATRGCGAGAEGGMESRISEIGRAHV